ncbi:hypothetical protein SDC9_74225 [bioreactor metagenome]|uniref:Uncharacterized protein n=1 Tax=bioreactor metagenome TaxID=1076179 RepID=A0A644YGI0_9ZZZZ
MVLLQRAELGGAAGHPEAIEEVDVDVVVVLPLLGQVVLVEDGLDRADGLAGAAVHALLGVDVQHAVALVDAIDRTLVDAGTVLHVDTRLRNDVRHNELLYSAYPGARPVRVVLGRSPGPSC